MVDVSSITVPIEVETFSYHTGDQVAYVRTQNPKDGEWLDWSVVRAGGSSKE